MYNVRPRLIMSHSDQKKMLDTGAGFYLDEEDLIEEEIKEKHIVQDPRKFLLIV